MITSALSVSLLFAAVGDSHGRESRLFLFCFVWAWVAPSSRWRSRGGGQTMMGVKVINPNTGDSELQRLV